MFLLQALQHFSVGFFLILIAISVSGSNLFLYSFYGQLAHDIYMSIADAFYESNWVILPYDLQKYFIVMLANAQRPLFYHGFGIAPLNLRTFLGVRKYNIYTDCIKYKH